MTIQGMLEEARQRLGVGEKTFKATPNTRCPAMLQETEDFSRHLLTYKQLLNKYEGELSAFLASVPVVSKATLPRVWNAVEGTTMCEPGRSDLSASHPYRVGGDFDEELMSDTVDIMRARIEGITRPIDRWLESLHVVKGRMKKLESLRVDVDARRRRGHGRFMKAFRRMAETDREDVGMGVSESMSYEDTFSSYILRRQRRRGTTGGDKDFMRERDEEDFARDALNQHRQLEAVTDSFNDQEEMVFEQLSKLCRDAAYFKSYCASSLVVFKDAVQSMLVACGPAKRPLPGFSDREPEYTEEHVDDLTDLAEALPKGFTLEGGKATITPEKKAEIPSGGRLGQQLKTSGVFQGVFQPSTAAREEPEQEIVGGEVKRLFEEGKQEVQSGGTRPAGVFASLQREASSR